MSALSSCCPVCKTTEKLLRCQGCMVMPYCCREHQIADRNNHKVNCNAVKNLKKNLAKEEEKLRENVLEEGGNLFSDIDEIHPYMTVRHSLVDKLLNINTFDAVKAAFDHLMDMVRLCRSENAFQFIVPALFIRLGMVQECYDFLKWHVTTGGSEDYDWKDMSLPFLDIQNADVFESVADFTGPSANNGYILPLMLIKMRLLLDVKSLQNSDILDDLMLPPHIVNQIRKEVAGKILSKRKDIMMSIEHDQLIEKLEKQMQELFLFANKTIKRFWARLLSLADYFAANPTACHIGMTVFYYYDALFETPGSIGMIKEWVQNNGEK